MATSESVLGEVERLSEGSAIKDCEELAKALGGDVGESVEKIQKLILRYYDDVRQQAAGSFNAARRVALAGFAVLTSTVAYVVAADIGARWYGAKTAGVMDVGTVGLVAGAIVELLAGAQFVLHSRTTRQFSAFHICLERTHRYLLAYKIAETIQDKDKTLEKVVCIMANAPMITRADIEGNDSVWATKTGGSKVTAEIAAPPAK